MPHGVYTYENVNKGACSIQPALDILEKKINNNF